MMLAFNRRVSEARGSDSGFAIAFAFGIGMVLLIMVVAATTFSLSGLKSARTDQDSAAALAAAYAGIDEYQSRLAGDSSYGQYGNPGSQFTIDTGSAATVILPPSSGANPAFNIGAGQAWATISGSAGQLDDDGNWSTPAGAIPSAMYRYEVDNSKFASNGVLRIRSTGKSGTATRSVVANLKGKGFIDFLYFTDLEVFDPALTTGCITATQPVVKKAWEPGAARPEACQEITFTSGDKLEGPVHSNDIMHICNATFTGTVTSAYPTAPYYKGTTGGTTTPCSGQSFAKTPAYSSSVTIPSTNQSMRAETAIDNAEDVPRPGCLYTGPTSIVFNANGTMTVKSPWTRYAHAGSSSTSSPAAGVTLTNCGTPGAAGLASAAGQTIPVIAENLIYVQGVQTTVGDPNYWATGATPAAPGFPGCYGAGGTSYAGNGLGYPTAKKSGTGVVQAWEVAGTSAYGCRNGDLFVKGTFSGRMTASAANYVYVVDNLVYADKDLDMLGLVGEKAIWVWNPVNNSGNLMLTDVDRTIQAALLSVENTFTVQNYNTAPSRGKLYITGAIAQKYRGIVSQAGGYIKGYKYDDRLKTAAPPKFLAPVSTTYGVTSYADVAAGFKPSGAP